MNIPDALCIRSPSRMAESVRANALGKQVIQVAEIETSTAHHRACQRMVVVIRWNLEAASSVG